MHLHFFFLLIAPLNDYIIVESVTVIAITNLSNCAALTAMSREFTHTVSLAVFALSRSDDSLRLSRFSRFTTHFIACVSSWFGGGWQTWLVHSACICGCASLKCLLTLRSWLIFSPMQSPSVSKGERKAVQWYHQGFAGCSLQMALNKSFLCSLIFPQPSFV